MVEVIKCPTCGGVFAACVDGSQDKEWIESRREYLAGGCKVDFVERQNFEFKSCDHPKTVKEIQDQLQLKLF